MSVIAPLESSAPRYDAAETIGLRRPALVGLAAVVALVVAAGRAPLPVGVELERAFGGLLHPSAGGGTASAATVVVAMATLVACWWRVLRLAGQGRVSLRAVGWTSVLWLAPVLVAPPLLSLDAYAYLAQGTMLASGLDPYSGGPVLLGDHPSAARVDPMWRASPTPYGPLTLLLFRAVALAPGDVTVGVLLLRAIALLGVGAALGAAMRLAPASRRPYVLALCALNPITLVHLVGGVHVDAALAGVIGLSLLALRHDKPWLAWLLAAGAVAVKITAAPLLLVVLVVLWRRGIGSRRLVAGATGLAALPFLASMAAVDRPWGFLAALTVPGDASPWYAPATVLGHVLAGVSQVLSLPVGESLPRTAARLVVLLLGGLVVLSLVRAELADDGVGLLTRTVQRASAALLVAVLCLPAVHGWYLAAGLFGLAAVGRPAWRGLLVAVSSCLTFAALPPLYAADRWLLGGAWAVALVVLAVAAVRGEHLVGVAPADLAHLLRSARADLARLPRRLLRAENAPVRERYVPGALRYQRMSQAAGLGLVVPVAVGLLSPGASASPGDAQERSERARVVRQLVEEYPGMQLVSVLPGPEPRAAYRIELVRPGHRTCRLLLAPRPAPGARLPRLPDDHRGRTLKAVDELTCPPPTLPAERPQTVGRPEPATGGPTERTGISAGG